MSVESLLAHDHSRYSLFAALRLLEALQSDRPRLGRSQKPTEDPIRIYQPPYLGFAATEVAGLGSDPAGRLRLEQHVFGSFGPNGPLPLHLTELAFERKQHRNDPGLADFVNLFQHRFASLFYRAWAQAEPAVQADRPDDDEFFACLAALAGLGNEAALQRDVVPDAAKVSRPGQLAQQTRSAEALRGLLSEYLESPVEIRELCPGWLGIPPEARLRLGSASASNELGRSATLGARTWQAQHQFEVVIGPVDREGLESMLPGRPALEAIRTLVELFTCGEWQWRLRVMVAQEAAPTVSLGRGTQLGWTSWVGQVRAAADQVVISGECRARSRSQAAPTSEVQR